MSLKNTDIILRRRYKFTKKFKVDYYFLVKSEMKITKSGNSRMVIYLVEYGLDDKELGNAPILKASYNSLESFIDLWEIVD